MRTGTPFNAHESDGGARADLTDKLLAELSGCVGPEADRVIQRIIEVNMELAETLARRYRRRGVRPEDLSQTAYLGLVKAVRGFDPERGANFLSFAVPTILGELRRHFRDDCWMVRPPRRIQELQSRIAPAREEFAQANKRYPTVAELADYLGARMEDVIEAAAADGCFHPSSLDRPLEPTSKVKLADTVGQDAPEYDHVDTHVALRPLLEQLPARERRVIELRYFWDWTQKQIADDIGVTQMQVSRILSRITRELRQHLTGPPSPQPATR